MRQRGVWVLALLVMVCGASWLLAQEAPYRRTDVFKLVNGLTLGEAGLSGMTAPSTGVVQVGGTDVTSLSMKAGVGTVQVSAAGLVVTMPAVQTIAAGETIEANACGGVKRITAAGAVTTSTTVPITVATAVPGCVMVLVNVGATNTITLDQSAALLLQGGSDVALAANSSIIVVSDGTVWRQASAVQTSS